MKKRILSILLAVLLIVGIMPTAVMADTPTITATYEWYGDGSATEFEIKTVGDLAGLANITNGADGQTKFDFAGKTVKLANDLDFEGAYWYYNDGTTTIDYRIKSFAGTFDGNYYSIKNMSYFHDTAVRGDMNLAFFDSITADGKLINLTIDTVTATFNYTGYTDSNYSSYTRYSTFNTVCATLAGTAFNCHAKNVNVSSVGRLTVQGFGKIDGANASADMCSVNGITITVQYIDSIALQGGSFGSLYNGGSITNCEAKNTTATCYGEMKYSGFGYINNGICKGNTTENINLIIKGPEGWTKDCSGFGSTGGVGTIEDCHVRNVTFNSESPYNLRMVGGFACTSTGTFKNCTVTDVTFNARRSQQIGGFIGEAQSGATFINCRVNNVTMNLGDPSDSTSKTQTCIGGFCGQANGGSSSVRTFDNCHVVGLNMTLNGKLGGDLAAGFIGQLGGTVDIKNCSVTGSIDATAISDAQQIGGFVGNLGWNGSTGHKFTNCVANVDIVAKTPSVGGFTAISSSNGNGANAASVEYVNCVANGDVTSAEGAAGGFVAIGARGTFENCEANGDVVGATTAGGFWGELIPSKSTVDNTVTITNCKATGQVKATGESGIASGFVGTVATAGEDNANATTVSISNSVASTVVTGDEIVAFAKDITPVSSTTLYTASDNTDGATSANFVARTVYDLGTAGLYKTTDGSGEEILQISGTVTGLTSGTFTVTVYDKFGEVITSAEATDSWSIAIKEGSLLTDIDRAPTYVKFTIDGLEYEPAIAVTCTDTNSYGFPMIWEDYFAAGVTNSSNESFYFFTHQAALDRADVYTNPTVTFLSSYDGTVTVSKPLTLDLGRYDAAAIVVDTTEAVKIEGIDRKAVVLSFSDAVKNSTEDPNVTKDNTQVINVPEGYLWIVKDSATDQLILEKHNVTFDVNGGDELTPDTQSVTYGEEYGTLPVPTRTGYQFEGWYTEATGGDKVGGTDIVESISNEILYAHWTANTYTIKFDANSGTGTMDSVPATYDIAENLPKNTFTAPENHYFNGWATAANGAVVYAAGTQVKNLTAENGVTVTLYAVWSAKEAFVPQTSMTTQNYTYSGQAQAFQVEQADGLTVTYRVTGSSDTPTAEAPTNAGSYDVIITKAEDDTCAAYSNTVTAGLVIAQKELTVTYEGESVVWSRTPVLTVKIEGFVNGEDEAVLTVVPTVTNANTVPGVYPLTPAGGEDENYFFTYVSGDLDIQKAGVKISYRGETITEGDTPALVYTVTWLDAGVESTFVENPTFVNVPTAVGQHWLVPQDGVLQNHDCFDIQYVGAYLTIDTVYVPAPSVPVTPVYRNDCFATTTGEFKDVEYFGTAVKPGDIVTLKISTSELGDQYGLDYRKITVVYETEGALQVGATYDYNNDPIYKDGMATEFMLSKGFNKIVAHIYYNGFDAGVCAPFYCNVTE